MRRIPSVLAALALSLSPIYAPAVGAATLDIATGSDVVMHGGGCRKSSPPGQCCHMEKKVGRVHCH